MDDQTNATPEPALSPSENRSPDNNEASQSEAPPLLSVVPEQSEPAPEEKAPTRDEERKAQADRVAGLRKKESLTSDEQKEIDEYERTKRKPGRKPKWWHEQRAQGIENPVEPTDAEKKSAPKNKAPSPPIIPTKVPKPPIFHVDETWKEKYKSGSENGREMVCAMMGNQWATILKAMQKQLEEVGVDSIVDVSQPEFENMLILAVDEILPDKVVATPAIIGGFATTTLMGQRFLHRKKIAAKQQNGTKLRNSLVSTINTKPQPVKDGMQERANPDGRDGASDKSTVD